MTYTSKDNCELLELYVLGGLADEEKEAFELHLNSCEECRAGRLALLEVIDLLPLSVEEQPVPAGMKRRVLSHVLGSAAGETHSEASKAEQALARELEHESGGTDVAHQADEPTSPEQREHDDPIAAQVVGPVLQKPSGSEDLLVLKRKLRTRNWQMRWLAAGLAAAVILFIVYAGSQRNAISDLRGQLAELSEPSTQQMKVAEAVQLAPAAENIVSKGLATIVIDQKGTHLVVQAEHLPELQGTEAFQVWLIKGDTKVSAGTFLSEQGHGAMYYTFTPQDYDTIAITLEPDAFGQQPRGEIVLAAPLKA